MSGDFTEQERREAEYKPTGHTYVWCDFCGRTITAYGKNGRCRPHRAAPGSIYDTNEDCEGSGELMEIVSDDHEIYVSPIDTLKVVRVQ